MDLIGFELHIPKKQIRAVQCTDGNRYEAVVHKLWLKSLIQHGRIVPNTVESDNLLEWPSKVGNRWQKIFITVHPKHSHDVIPLPRNKERGQAELLPITYSQLIHYVSQSNHRGFWKSAYNRYTGSRLTESKVHENISINLTSYDVVLRHAISRTYKCSVVPVVAVAGAGKFETDDEEPHPNTFPAVAALETTHSIFVIHPANLENTLLDCVTYSPAILDDYNKPLFLIYQLLNLVKGLHDRGVLLGEVNLHDIYLTENLWLQIFPQIKANLIEYKEETAATTAEFNVNLVNDLEVRYSLKDYVEMWVNNQISNFDYLTILNNFAGRRMGCPGYHHIMPWVTDFTARNGATWRDLTKSKYRLNKGDAQLEITFQPSLTNIPHHVSDVLSEITYYVYMARRTPKEILCKHVRPVWVPGEYPASIQRLQEWTPDECIPEFFTDPQVFKSMHEDLPDLQVPKWATCPEDFVNKHREALESQWVSEKLHLWIDLTFGCKLSGTAAVKAKNVCLPLVDRHKNLCKRGIVQLFYNHHPQKQIPNSWSGKNPPRIRSQSESRRRLTRSTEDLTLRNIEEDNVSSMAGSARTARMHQTESIERSPSCHVNVNRNTINLPKNYNPIAQLTTLENLQSFQAKTFSGTQTTQQQVPMPEAGYTNQVFDDQYTAKRRGKSFKQIINESRAQDLRMVGVLIMEIFLPAKMRAHGSCNKMGVQRRIEVCENLLKTEMKVIPACVQYPLRVLFGCVDTKEKITEKGLPQPDASQLLEPILSNSLFPFPVHYFKVYAIMKMLYDFKQVGAQLELFTFFECDGGQCQRYETLDKTRIAFNRKLAECKVNSCVALIESLLQPTGNEQFSPVQLLLPHIVDLINDDETSILTAWYLFDLCATALGPVDSQKYLLAPLIQLYDVDDPNTEHPTSSFKHRKAVKLYHHSFLLKLIVRFGLKCFLDNFVPPIIEAVGGYKDTAHHNKSYHSHHENNQQEVRARNMKISEADSSTLISPTSDKTEKTISPIDDQDDVFTMDDSTGEDTTNAILKILDHFEIRSESGSLDLKLNYSTAIEVTEDEQVFDSLSCDDETVENHEPSPPNNGSQSSLPIPFHRNLNTINCEVGSKKSIDSIDVFSQNMDKRESPTKNMESSVSTTRSGLSSRSTRISEVSSESLIWLSHRLGPVLTARYLTRNLLKMLTLCYVGHENLIPENAMGGESQSLGSFTIADSRVVGDQSAANVLECLGSMAALFGEQFILLQYFPHISELIALCRKKITPSLEGGLISSLQLLKFLTPCLTDTVLMEQLQDVILQNIIHPVIRLVGSGGTIMPSGYLARSVLARKLVDCLYVFAIRIGPTMTNNTLCVPALQRFFLIFDKAYDNEEIQVNDKKWASQEELPPGSPHDDEYLEIRRDGRIKEWTVKGTQITSRCIDAGSASELLDAETMREKALEEIKDVFTPCLAFAAYTSFLRYLGEAIMHKTVSNKNLITTLCLEHKNPEYSTIANDKKFESTTYSVQEEDFGGSAGSFGSNVAVIGNRIDVQNDSSSVWVGTAINMVAYKFDTVNNSRHLRGNWLAYWEHEIGRADKDNRFNLKQIKLQTYTGHLNSVKAIVCLDNENSFMSASKDKTVKLWSLRSEGDGTRVSSCQFTYTNHKKSVHSLAFLESMRLTVSCDSGVHVWDPFVGSQVGYFDAPRYSPVTVVKAYAAPSALVLAGTSESTLKMIDARTFTYVNEWKLTSVPAGSVRSIAVGGNWIATGLSSGQIILLDSRTGYIINSWRGSDNELLQLATVNETQMVSSTLDHNISVWNTRDGSLMHHLRSPPEPAHCVVSNGVELLVGTPANRLGNYATVTPESSYTFTKLRSEIFRGVLTSLSVLPLNRMLLIGSDNGNITLLC